MIGFCQQSIAILEISSRSLKTANMSKVEFDSANSKGPCPGVLQGEGLDTTKGLIVLQEWWGMNDQIVAEAKMIGENGKFKTIVPDLYRGKVATDSETAGHLMDNLDWDGALADIAGAAKFLMSKGCKKVGVTGFCMGGALSLATAVKVSEISAAAPFYGIPDSTKYDVSTITIPVQAHFGDKDDLEGFSSPADAEALKGRMKDERFELFMYPGCGHAFTNPTGPMGNYNEEQCKIALGRMQEFMNKYLA
ncbi:protein usf-like isoform X2 [Mya arenaria]|uniref:protein usf-like isoform X2 n=1 Tax=Mya arenaria TaxID=6604 RepID=UPI0022E6F13D|nr:protein usf-like isoform X2 [Mya arenaria]